MIRKITIYSILFICISCKSEFQVIETPTNYSTVIKNHKIEGVIFLKNADCFLCLGNKKRFSPTLTDIQKAETILKQNIKKENNPLINQGDNCPVIHKNLANYRRQYFGYVDENGNKIIYITFYWNKYTILDRLKEYEKVANDTWKTEKSMVLDGCSHYWEININLDKQELFGLGINGSA
ncbi:MAG: hypothetical protein LBV31_01785 [Prevotellaceae bacterium]|jgi:hypothetical protein|nr:hypothetical protein [Prevotellaceae bacterium]